MESSFPVKSKKCVHCREIKKINEFKYSSGGGDGHNATCKDCLKNLNKGKVRHYRRWGLDKIRIAMERFKTEFGRYPSASHFYSVDYLPSPGLIQDTYGGFQKLRQDLNLKDTHLGKGSFRSKIAFDSHASGLALELKIERLLVDKFHEPYVHTQKRLIINNKSYNLDFFVYSPDFNFGVDMFNTDSEKNLKSNINIKIPKYRSLSFKIVLVAEINMSQETVDQIINRKSDPVPEHIKILTVDNFIHWFSELSSYPRLSK